LGAAAFVQRAEERWRQQQRISPTADLHQPREKLGYATSGDRTLQAAARASASRERALLSHNNEPNHVINNSSLLEKKQ